MNDGSALFIKWATAQLEDGYTYHEYFRKAHSFLLKYEKADPVAIKNMLVEKLTKAADEYGDPISNKDKYNFDKELEMEVMDLVFGWPMVRQYLKDK
jgi:hypothetical protein